ncbi:MAG: DUF6268 family outer membrane beta-barrel protein [Candidatus Omnitrophica bacterium]|jgi:hypothetical protein|nr:DUF6268 family outer membrane beta-barrel protein [Candidatus Omnitrophota bacterium]
MPINNKFSAVFFLPIAVILCTVSVSDLCAEEDALKEQIQEQIMDEAGDDSGADASAYRQKLGKTIVEEEEFYNHDLDTYVRYMPSRGAGSQSGKVGIVDSASEYSYTLKAFGQLPVEFAVGTKYIGITNSTVVELPSRLTSIFIGAETTLPFFNVKNTYLTIGLAPAFHTDNWGIRSSALSLAQRYFFIHQANDKLAFIAGVSISPHESDPVMPILGFIYKPTDRLTFNIVPKQPEISYDLTDKLTVFGQADMTMDEYRVNKDGKKNTVLEYNEMHAGAGLRYAFNKYIQGNISAGGIFNRSIKYREDYNGKVTVKNGMYTEFRVDITI